METVIACLLGIALCLHPVQETENQKLKAVEKLPSAKSVISKYVMALGGFEEIESRTSIHWRSNISTSQGQNYVYEAWQGVGKYACRLDQKAGTTLYTRGVWADGSLDAKGHRAGFAWQQTGDSLIERKDAELQEYLRRRTYVSSAPTWLTDCKSVKCIGVESVHDKKAYQVRVVDHNGTEIDLFFDAETGLLLRRFCIEAYNGTTQEVTRDRFDYEKVGNTMVPMKETVSWNNIVYVYQTEFYNVNEKVPKGTFKVPGSIQKQIDALQNSRQQSTLTSRKKKSPPAKSETDEPATKKPASKK